MRKFLSMVLLISALSASAGTVPDIPDAKIKDSCTGLVNLYITDDNKIYAGLPLNIIGRDMMMGTMVERCSDPMESSAGYQPENPVLVHFEIADSTVLLCRNNDTWYAGGVSSDNSHIPSVLESFRIEGYNNDSTEVVFEATSFFMRSDKSVDPIDPKAYNGAAGAVKRTGTHLSENTYLSGYGVFDDNFSVSVCHTYRLKSAFLGVFAAEGWTNLTSEVRRTFILLPQDRMPLKKADDRVGTYYVSLDSYSDSQTGSREDRFSVRWRLDTDSSGIVVKPVCFYIDNAFPSSWIPYIAGAIDEWNKAFENAGLRNALTYMMYPEDSAWFNQGNIKYPCIRYNFSMSENISDSRFTDPRTGEILGAGIYVNAGICESIRRDLILQTGAASSDSRNEVIPEALFGSILKSRMMRSIGHCLGLTDNMAGSFAYSPDSLKYASFTDIHGLSASVMDDLPLNFVGYSDNIEKKPAPAITQEKLGPYDYMAIEWLYGNPADDLWQNRPSPEYEYGKKQSPKSFYDPRSMALDLGNDFTVSAGYGLDGLANVVKGLDSWLDIYDTDYSIRNRMQEYIILQAYEYIKQVFVNVGGIYLYPKYDGEALSSYQSVPSDIQRRCLLWAMDRIEDMSFLDNSSLEADWQLTGSTSDFCEKYFSRFIFMQIDAMWLSESKSEETRPYTQIDAMEDVNRYIWKEAINGEKLTDLRRFQQSSCVDYLLMWSGFQGGAPADIHRPDRANLWYGMLLDVSEIISRAEKRSRVQADKDHYAYLSYRIRKALR